ncbi:MAG: hypothetical protein COC04_00895 [Gammaproteobacteria bacterium]|nr:MAG: hypothetical protein COC04_00895 [Gammaproteobacteria bacterium]
MKKAEFSLESIGLKKSACETFPGTDAASGRLQITLNVGGDEPAGKDKDRFDLIVTVELEVTGIDADDCKVFEVSTKHNGGFVLQNGKEFSPTDEDQALQLSKQIIPVARAHQTDLLDKMGLGNVYLPWSFETTEE